MASPVCRTCGQHFMLARRGRPRLYCTPKCRRKYHYGKTREREIEARKTASAKREAHKSDSLMSVEAVAAHLCVSVRTVYRWVERGIIPAIKIGSTIRFAPAQIEAVIQAATIPAVAEKRQTPGPASI
jgi:excisionase family DNA binding protein